MRNGILRIYNEFVHLRLDMRRTTCPTCGQPAIEDSRNGTTICLDHICTDDGTEMQTRGHGRMIYAMLDGELNRQHEAQFPTANGKTQPAGHYLGNTI